MGGRETIRRLCAILVTLAAALAVAGASSAAPPSNDSFASAQVLLAATGSYSGTNVDATKEAGEPSHADNVGGASVWYKWVAPYSGTATFDTIGSGFDSLLAVYTGSSVDSLTPVASNDDFMGWKWTSKLGFAATAGTAYWIAVDGYNDGANGPALGTFAVNWDLDSTGWSPQPNDSFANAVQIDGPGGSTGGSSFRATKEVGEPNHAGNVGGHSVWFRWTAPYDGTFTFSTDTSDFNTLLAVYSGVYVGSLTQVAANDDIAWNNQRSTLSFVADGGTTYSIAVDGKKFDYSGAASGNYALTWSSQTDDPNRPANDWFSNPQPLAGASGSTSGSTVAATKEPGEPSHAGNAGGASVWYSWTAPVSGNVDFTTAGSGIDTLLGIYTGSAIGSLAQVAANDDIGPGKGPSDVVFAATAGTTYRIAVDGYLDQGAASAPRGDVVLSWSVVAATGPANDDFDSALTLTGIGGIVNRSTLGANKETGEPNHAGNPGGASAWIRWTAPSDGQWRFYTAGSTFNTLLGVYTGDSVDALSLVGSSDDVSPTDKTSSVTIIARAETTYYFAVDGYRGAAGPAASGAYTLQWELLGPDPALAPNDDFAAAWAVSGQSGAITASNAASTKEAGEPAHAGNPGGASVWFKWTAPANGYVSWDTPGSSFDTLLGAYTGTSMADLKQVAANDDIQYNRWWPDGRYRESFLSFIAQQGTTYYVAVDGKAAPGGAPARGSIFMEWWQNPPDPGATLLTAGDVHAACDGTNDDKTAQILAGYPNATIAANGDLADPGSTDTAFANCYGPTWGQFKDRTRPAPGNHEYDYSPTAAPYFNYFGANAGAPGKGYYSYELGGWHIVVLNSMCAELGDGCGPGSAEYAWLQQDLASNVNSCLLAYWHYPVYASSSLARPDGQPFWNLLYQYGADVVVNAHARQYERFTPLASNGTVDLATGIRQFVVGTGGADPLPTSPIAPNSELINTVVYGVLKLTLRTGSYDWQFLPTAGSTFTDAGKGSCAGGSTAYAAAPPKPTLTAGLSATGQFQVKWTASPDIPTGATYGLYERSISSSTWTLVGKGLTGTTYTYGSTNAHAEGTWVYRVQAVGASRISDFSADSAPIVVDKSAPLAPLLKPDRPAEYPAGGWWRDTVTVSSFDSGDPVLADGTPGSGTNKSTLITPQTKNTFGTFTIADQVSDMVGWQSKTASIVVKVDNVAPTLTLTCGDVYWRATYYARFTAKDDQSGLATPSSGSVLEPSAVRGKNRLTIQSRDNVGHVTTRYCDYYVK